MGQSVLFGFTRSREDAKGGYPSSWCLGVRKMASHQATKQDQILDQASPHIPSRLKSGLTSRPHLCAYARKTEIGD